MTLKMVFIHPCEEYSWKQRFHNHIHGQLEDTMLTNPLVPYDLCIGNTISHLLMG